ncbi:hypothetical protein BGZ83_008294 [Gryganskiella cystojenkinii]|nr:hypothetical protein BGZ83_008294 [Gryganskiella cystojenkinii]
MSDYTKELHDPATDTPLEEPLDDGTSSGILLNKDDYENHSSPDVSSLASSAVFEHPAATADQEKKKDHHTSTTDKTQPASLSLSEKHPVPATPTPLTSTALSTEVVDLNQNMPWKLFYPVISRETILAFCKATAINFLLPFVNGVFLGFGEICAHELTYRWGWTNSAHVVSVPGRRPVGAGDVGIRAAGVSGAGSVGSVSATNASSSSSYSGVGATGYAGSRSGIGGLGHYDEEFVVNETKSRQY